MLGLGQLLDPLLRPLRGLGELFDHAPDFRKVMPRDELVVRLYVQVGEQLRLVGRETRPEAVSDFREADHLQMLMPKKPVPRAAWQADGDGRM